ncbi:MAG: phosphopantetheine-binding protein [Mycoplasmoidaceae bacterium]|nr:phosphopantetheine-binding protein [Mycoplasmoidaceae bacterium]
MKDKILSVIKDVANKQKINVKLDEQSLSIDFKKLGIDSIIVLSIIVAIEDKVGFRLDDSDLMKIKTINQLIAAFEAKQK